MDTLRLAADTDPADVADALVVEAEVVFHGDGLLFADVDTRLREQGFVLWQLRTLRHAPAGDVVRRLDATVRLEAHARPVVDGRIGGGQLASGEASFVRAALLEGGLDPDLSRRAADAALAVGLSDLAVVVRPELGPELVAQARELRKARRAAKRAELRERQRQRQRRRSAKQETAAAPPPPRSLAQRVLRRLGG